MRSISTLRTTARRVGVRAFASRSIHRTALRKNQTDVGPHDELARDFLEPRQLHNMLAANGVNFYTGVPDSLLKDFCAYVTDHVPTKDHVIAANEGSAVAMAAGYHLATKKIPLVYLQNSGLGNMVKPLLSLAATDVYSIPMLLLVGWRGEPGKRDEPQHRLQGKLTPGMFASMDIDFEILPDFEEGAEETIAHACDYVRARQSPFALLVKRQCFSKYELQTEEANPFSMTREEALSVLMDHMGDWDVVVGTTGFASRELYELREQREQSHERDFLTVGSMGHASAIALGIAIQKPSRQVVCLDGDGALAMHLGNALTVGKVQPKNFMHVVLNNGVHDSVGAQPTGMLENTDLGQVALGTGYKAFAVATTPEEVAREYQALSAVRDGPTMLEIKLKPGARSNLGRPKTTPVQNRDAFMRFLDE